MQKSGVALRVVTACLSIAGSAATVEAAPATRAGEQVGLTAGYPLPTGVVIAVDTVTVGRADRPNAPDAMGTIPFLVWASPYKLFGGQIQPVVSFPVAFISTRNPAPLPNRDLSVRYNPLLAGVLAWNLGNGVGVSYLLGAYLPFGDRGSLGLGFAGTPLLPQAASATLRQTFAATYVGDGSYNISASLSYGLTLDPRARFGGPVGQALGPIGQADGLGLDLTLVKKFGKFEIGPVAYGSLDLAVDRGDPLYRDYQRTGQFAVGGLVGYNFDRFILQAYVARDIVARQTRTRAGQVQDNEETRGWFRLVLPLYAPGAGRGSAPQPTPLMARNEARP
ncbi:UNVERIFIED_CONTAM: transporter [Methylobacteriaceae bacterium AG10]|nr:transporter [Methylobacteriaceae bacterium AG10]